MSAGELRELIAFEKRGEVDDGYGNKQSGPFAEVFSCAARVMPLRGGEAILNARLQGRQPVIIKVRVYENTKAVTTEWRARDARSGTIYNIRSIANTDEKQKYFEMMAESGVAT